MASLTTVSGRAIEGPDYISIHLSDPKRIRDPEFAGNLSLAGQPIQSPDMNIDSLETRLNGKISEEVKDLRFDASVLDFVGLYNSQRVFYIEGSPIVITNRNSREKPIGTFRALYLEDSLQLNDEFAKKMELDKVWIPVPRADGLLVANIRPSYAADFVNAKDLNSQALQIFLDRLEQERTGVYRIKGRAMIATSIVGRINKLGHWPAVITHDDIKFELSYADRNKFNVIPYVEKGPAEADKSESTLVLRGKRNFPLAKAAAVILSGAAICGLFLYTRGCFDNIGRSKEGSTPIKYSQGAIDESQEQQAVPGREARDRSATREEDEAVRKETMKPKAEHKKVTKRDNIPGREARVRRVPGARPGVKGERGAETSESADGRAEAVRLETYLPPIREGDPFYEEFRDNIDGYLEDCVNKGGPGTEGAFVFDYIVDVYGKITKAVVREGIPGKPIPTTCAEGLREVMLRQTLESAADGLYTNKDVIILGGE